MTTNDDLTTLEAKAAKAQAAYERAQAAAAEARDAELTRQEGRARKLDAQTVAQYSDDDYLAAQQEARDELARVIAASDIGRAWIAVQAADARHAHASVERNGAASRLGRPDRVPDRSSSDADANDLAQIVSRAAAQLVYAELEQREAQRLTHIAGTDEV